MANFVLAYTGGTQPASEEEQQRVMQAWMSWFDGLGQAVVDGGNPFARSVGIEPGGAAREGAPSGLTGYSVLAADDLDAAVELAKGCLQLEAGGTVEVYETIRVM